MPASRFHPAVQAWFAATFPAATAAQSVAWPAIASGHHALIAAPTGSGKTLAAFLSAIDSLVHEGAEGRLEDVTRVVYVSPLKALSNDIQRNLEQPLAGIGAELTRLGMLPFEIRAQVRTGDTSQADRAAMRKRPPHILVTTPESLYLLLTSESGREMLSTARTVIVDEIHAVAGTKRGAHLALSLERLSALAPRPLQRIGLSATQKPIEEVARFLVGTESAKYVTAEGDGSIGRELPAAPESPAGHHVEIVNSGHVRQRDLGLVIPGSPLEAVMSGEVWDTVYAQLASLVLEHRTTLIFANTRRMVERVTRHLAERIGDMNVAAHHGSLAKEQRFDAEQRLKAGKLKAMVATASLELGIDIGDVELVVQLGSPRSISTFLQRVGRANHSVGGIPKGRLFPSSRDELVEGVALLDAVRRGELDRLSIPKHPLDVLSQQIVAEVSAREYGEDELFDLVRRAWPYRDLDRKSFDEVVRMLSEGISTRRGRRSTYLHRDAVNKRLRGRRGSRLTAITCGGAIPDNADYQVILEPAGTFVGTVNEDWAVESLAGDIFQLGNTSYRILRVEAGRIRVEDAKGQPPSIPFWLGEAPARTMELSQAVSRLREDIEGMLDVVDKEHIASCITQVMEKYRLERFAAEQLVEYLAAAKAVLGKLPTQDTLVFERFFDESGGMQLVIHSPFGARINKAYGLALRKRFCRAFNFELQAAATEDAIVLSLGETHSFELESIKHYLHSNTVEQVLTQAVLDAPLFTTRWRWNAAISLAVRRNQGGKRTPPPLQRMAAEDLISVVFPDQIACAENLTGEREIPDHPLVNQTLDDCLHEAMDVEGLKDLLRAIERGEKQVIARDLPTPSPLSQEILTARPYAYLDDAPLEERRTQAVASRRWSDPETAADLGKLDPAAIAQVREEAWPSAENPDELHDALISLGLITEEEGMSSNWTEHLAKLNETRRAARLYIRVPKLNELHIAAEKPVKEPPAKEPPQKDPPSKEPPVKEPGKQPPVMPPGPKNPEIIPPGPKQPEIEPPGKPGPGEVPPPQQPPDQTPPTEIPTPGTPHPGNAPIQASPRASAETPGDGTSALEENAPGVMRERAFWVAAEMLPMLAAIYPEHRLDPQISAPAESAARTWAAEEALVELVRGRLQGLGPVTIASMVESLGLTPTKIEAALTTLESEGFVLRGQFTGNTLQARREGNGLPPTIQSADDPGTQTEWCERRLLARIHRYTIRTLRAEIEPVSTADFMRFLLEWQGVTRQPRPEGLEALAGVIAQLEGYEIPAAAWESDVLAARLNDYDPNWLDSLCLSGRALWARLTPSKSMTAAPVRATPIALLTRKNWSLWHSLSEESRDEMQLSHPARAMAEYLGSHGASFFEDIVTGTGLLKSQAESGLGELVAAGIVNADSYSGLRALLIPSDRKRRMAARGRRIATFGLEDAGRWSLIRKGKTAAGSEAVEQIAQILLRRYGVVFRRVLEREADWLPPWHQLLRVYRRLEAQGTIRGGRFVAGMSGEQYALPDAVGALRAVRRRESTGDLVSLSAADPLNLAGIITPGQKVPALASNRILLRDGVPVATHAGGQTEFMEKMEPADEWAARQALLHKRMSTPPSARPS